MHLLFGLVLSAVVSAPPAPPGTGADSLDLAGALALARQRSPVLAAARAGVREAGAGIDLAGAGRGTRLEAGAYYLRYQDPPSVALGPLRAFTPIRRNGLLLQLLGIRPLYTGGRVAALEEAARRGREAALARARQAEVEVTAAVARAFADALLARGLAAVAEEAVAVLEEAARVAGEAFREGTVARIDVLRAETRLASARAALRAARDRRRDARDRLAATIGVPPSSLPPLAGSLEFVEEHPDSAALHVRARTSRGDIGSLAALARVQEARARAAGASRRPAASLYLAGLLSNPELITGRERWSLDLLGGLALRWPFLDGGRSRAEAGAARAAAARVRAEARRLEDSVAVVLAVRLRELRRASADVREGRANVERAERVFRIARERYREGLALQLEVLEAQAELARVRADLLRAVHGYRAAAIDLRRLAGLPADAALPGAPRGGGAP